ncbi:S8 family serine peptidase [Limibacter armeniacum]|uniref:S8 family serine peptidase n=1 Tax=Limibacter armeniacum TaxID=466084 RepID=UPI002FE608E0
MKKYFLLLLIIPVLVGTGYGQLQQTPQGPVALLKGVPAPTFRTDKFFVRLKSPDDVVYAYPSNGRVAAPADKQRLVDLLASPLIRNVHEPFAVFKEITSDVLEITLQQTADIEHFIERFTLDPNVAEIERIPMDYLFQSTNDPRVGEQYFLTLTKATSAWEKFTPSTEQEIVVAIIDDAVLVDHEDLKDNIFINEIELNGEEGVDDDGNGYIDDVNGWDPTGLLYFNGDPNPSPPAERATSESFTHGTHTAGLAGAVTGNGKGIASISRGGVKILPIKATSDDTSDTRSMSHTLEGIEYAIAMNADVVSMSFGSYSGSTIVQQLITQATKEKGMIFIAAAGNDNVPVNPYPAGYDNVIAVANTTQNDTKASSSNFGPWIDIAAPGTDILSTTAGSTSDYGFLTGTSMSCPIVAGMAAMLKAQNPSLTPLEVERIMKATAKDLNETNPEYQNQLGAGRIDVLNALEAVIENRPWADFVIGADAIVLNKQVTFINQSVGTDLSYTWNFGDGETSTEESPSHIYTVDPPIGSYAVSLTVSDGAHSHTKRSFVKVVEGAPEVVTRQVPYTLADGGNFESNPTDFVPDILQGRENIVVWELGVAEGPILRSDTLSTGKTVWKTTLNGSIPNETFVAALYSPAFDLSNQQKEYKVQFKKSMDITYCNAPAAVQMQYSIDGGISWARLGEQGDGMGENWYDKAPGGSCDIDPSIVRDQHGWIGIYNYQDTEYNISFLGGNSSVRFRWVYYMNGNFFIEETDDGFMIDDFQLTAEDPKAEFTLSSGVAYQGQEVEFRYASGGATEFLWNFGDGGTSSTYNPIHTYATGGVYDVELTVNGNVTQTKKISVLGAIDPPFELVDGGDLENFDNNKPLFYVDNQEGSTLELGNSTVTGKSGTASGSVAYVLAPDEQSYQVPTSVVLYSSLYDLTGKQGNYFLEFKTKYNMASGIDGLIGEYTEDAGKTWSVLKPEFATHWYDNVASSSSGFVQGLTFMSGETGDEFVKKYINISDLVGKKVAFRFTFLAVNSQESGGVGFAIDDFRVITAFAQPENISFVAARLGGTGNLNFSATSVSASINEQVLYLADATGDYLNYEWDFGEGAVPRKAKGAGPHFIVYTTPGAKDVKFTILGTESGSESITKQGFAKIGGVTSIADNTMLKQIKVYPNPMDFGNKLTLDLEGAYTGEVQVLLYSVSGKLEATYLFNKRQSLMHESLIVSDLPVGIYLLRVVTDQGSMTQKLIRK